MDLLAGSADVSSNIMSSGPSILRRPTSQKSNVELVNSLRANFRASKQAVTLARDSKHTSQQNGDITSDDIPYEAWTVKENDNLYIPSIDFESSGLIEERGQYDITVKLFFLPGTSASQRCQHAKEAIDVVLKELNMPSIDLLIVSFPGVTLDSSMDCHDPVSGDVPSGEGEDLNAMTKTWKALEWLQEEGLARRIGVAEFGKDRLQNFLHRTKLRPAVNQISLKDNCTVPKPLLELAKQENIALLEHMDCTNILPSGTIRDLLGPGPSGAGVLAGPTRQGDGIKGDIAPQWVIKYTAVVENRGVIENRGYFAMAELRQ